MPTLAQTIEENRKKQLVRSPTGQLTAETQESTQDLAAKAGLPAAPTTPLGVSQLGGNPDQAKMAGTPAQMQNAISMSQQPNQSLQDTLRRQQARTQQTSEEQSKEQKSQDMSNLGNLGTRVNDLIQSQVAKLQQAAPQPTQVQAQANYTTAAGQTIDLAPISSVLEQLRQNPSDMNLQLQVNQHLGRDINSAISPAEINSLYESSKTAIGRAGAEVVDDTANVSDLLGKTALGQQYDLTTLSQLLGVPPQEVQGFNVAQLRNKIAEVQANEFAEVQRLQQQAQSGNLGSAERAGARGLLRDASASGLRSTEADVDRLNQSIANADQVNFGGQQYAVTDLLKDETISGIIQEYLEAGPDSPTRQQLEQTEPGLIEFIKKNEAALDDAAKQLSSGATQFGDIQQFNKTVTQNLGAINPQVLQTIIPGAGQLSANQYAPGQNPVIDVLLEAQGNPEKEQQIAGALNDVFGSFPDLAESFSNVPPEAFKSLITNPQALQAEVNKLRTNRALMPLQGSELISALTNGAQTEADVSNLVRDSAAHAALGFPTNPAVARFDSNGDGVIDASDVVKNNSRVGNVDATQFFSGSTPQANTTKVSASPKITPTQEAVKSALAPHIRNGQLTEDAVWAVYNDKNITDAGPANKINKAEELLELSKSIPAGSPAKQIVQRQLQTARKSITEDKLAEARMSGINIMDMPLPGGGRGPLFTREGTAAALNNFDGAVTSALTDPLVDKDAMLGYLREQFKQLVAGAAGESGTWSNTNNQQAELLGRIKNLGSTGNHLKYIASRLGLI